MATQEHVINIIPGVSAPLIIHCSYGDKGTKITLDVYNYSEPYDCTGQTVSVHGVRADSFNWGPVPCTVNKNKISFVLTSDMTGCAGPGLAEVTIGTVSTANFCFMVERGTWCNGTTQEDDISVYQAILNFVQNNVATVQSVESVVTALNQEISARLSADTALQNNLDNATESLQKQLDTEITERETENKSLLEQLSTEVSTRSTTDASLQAQIDELVAPSGEAPSAAEVENARIGADSTVYPTLGDAIRSQITDLIKELIVNNSFDFLSILTRNDKVHSGVTYNWNGNSCFVTGTATAISFANIFASTNSLPYGIKPGGKYWVDFKSDKVALQIFQMGSDGSIVSTLYGRAGSTVSDWITVPNNISGMVVRLFVASGTTVNETVTPKILSHFSNEILTDSATVFNGILPTGTDLNNVTGGCWLLPSDYEYVNSPIASETFGTLLHFEEYNVKFQVVLRVTVSAAQIYVRSAINGAGNYNQWRTIDGGGGGVNNYNFETYENTYNVTASPTITTDTNSYLAPTGDSTDVTASIVTMLTQTGVCRLGKGDYYVKNLVMTHGPEIIGSGYATRIILLGSSDGFAIKMQDHCVVKDVQIVGSTSSITLSSVVGNRHGIVWQGTYTQDQTAPYRSIIDSVFINNFTGGGITCYDTGYGTSNCIEVTNAFIWQCNAGVNISYWSEFHKFTNVRAGGCYYGCINNGGNNIFVNCDFSSNKLAFLMDNASNQSPNNSHGSCIGCVFNHTDSNAGVGIKILNCDNGFMFDGCQIFFSQIDIEDSDGVVISNTNFGLNNCNIKVVGGGTVLFANNMHQGAPTISITNNTNVHFVNCYNRSTGTVIAA